MCCMYTKRLELCSLISLALFVALNTIGDVFKESNIRTVPCAYATPISNGLVENLIQFTIKTKKRKRVILTSYWSAKVWYKRVLFPIFFNVFRHCEPIGLRKSQNIHFRT